MDRTDKSLLRFSISNLLVWIAVFALDITCFRCSLAGSNGWLIGYSRFLAFSVASILAILLVGEPIRRINRWFVWPCILACCVVVCTTGGLIWYIQSFVPVFIERGVADTGKIAFKKLTWNTKRAVIIKYDVWDLPDCENTGYLIPWRDGYRSLSDDYLAQQNRR